MYKIAHIADTHIRNLKYHDEYRIAFRDLYEKLANDSPDCIVHCGDIAHTKTQLSPEYFQLCAEFLSSLANIAPTYVILGNHDGNLKNDSRQDAQHNAAMSRCRVCCSQPSVQRRPLKALPSCLEGI